jgi:4-amino-4-deoxy-L-arabinose transferase-like glycosyltransferase
MKDKLTTILILLAILASGLFFGLPRITKFSGTDETLWSYDRIPTFWNAVSRQRWKSTQINDKPGITLAILSGSGLPFIPSPEIYGKLAGKPKTLEQLNTINDIYFHLRLPIFIFFLASLPLFYFFIKKLLSKDIAYFSIIFIGLSPIILGISLVLNPDSLLWAFLPLSILSFLIFQQEESKKYLYLSGLFLGLSLLTKYVSNILYVYFFGLILLEYIFNEKKRIIPLFQYLKKSLFNYVILAVISTVTFFALFPATWVNPNIILDATILSRPFLPVWIAFVCLVFFVLLDTLILRNKILRYLINSFSQIRSHFLRTTGILFLLMSLAVVVNTYFGMLIYDFGAILSDPKWLGTEPTLNIFISQMLGNLYTLLFGLTPIVALLFLYAIFVSTRTEKIDHTNITILYFIFFIFLYYAGSAINHVTAILRYQVALFPIASIIAAIGLSRIIEKFNLAKYRLSIIIPLIFITSLASLSLIRPYYFSYQSVFLPEKYPLNALSIGDGSWEASQYLNGLENAENMNVWSDREQVCEKFIGRCVASLKPTRTKNTTFDYYISSTFGKQKTLKNISPNEKILRIGENIVDPSLIYSPDNNFKFKAAINGTGKYNFIKVSAPADIITKQ